MDEGESDPDERPDSGDDAGPDPSEPAPQGAEESPARPEDEPGPAAEDVDATAEDVDATADGVDSTADGVDSTADGVENAEEESASGSGDPSDDPFPFPIPDDEGAGEGPQDGSDDGPDGMPGDGPDGRPEDVPDDATATDRIDFDPTADPQDAVEAAGEGDATGDADEPGGAPADPHAVDGGEAAPAEAATVGGSREEVPVPGGEAAPSPASPEPAGGDFGAGAPDDQEMPLAAHVEEMVKRLAVVLVIMAIVSAITFPFADRIINFLWYSFLPGTPQACLSQPAEAATNANQACPRVYHPLSLMLARLKTASMVGLVAALPVLVYQSYLFMRPGLYPNERRYYLASVPTSLVLATVGVGFAYFLVLPVIFTYFLGYSLHAVDTIAFSLTQTFDLILLMMGLFALVFQIPLFMMLAIMMGVTTRQWLQRRRIYFWGGFLGIAFLFSPDPTGMAPFIVAITMVFLFEGTLLLLRWTGR